MSATGNHYGTVDIVCPHCDHALSDSWEYGQDEDVGEIECGHCEMPFYARRMINITYASETLDVRRRRA